MEGVRNNNLSKKDVRNLYTKTTGKTMEMSFDESVKRQKAVEWLLKNDPKFQHAAAYAKQAPVAAILMAAEFGQSFAIEIAEVAKRMTVTDEERREGYPLPENDYERQKRAQTRTAIIGGRLHGLKTKKDG